MVQGQQGSQIQQHSLELKFVHKRRQQHSLELKFVHGRRKYSVDSERHSYITKQLAIFIGSTNVPISLVDNEALRS